MNTHPVHTIISVDAPKIRFELRKVALDVHVLAHMPPAFSEMPQNVGGAMWNSRVQALPNFRYPCSQYFRLLMFPQPRVVEDVLPSLLGLDLLYYSEKFLLWEVTQED